MTAVDKITIRRATQGDAAAVTSATRAAYAKYGERIGRVPEAYSASFGFEWNRMSAVPRPPTK